VKPAEPTETITVTIELVPAPVKPCGATTTLAIIDHRGTPRFFDVVCRAAEGHLDRGLLDVHMGTADALTEAGFGVNWPEGAWPVRFLYGFVWSTWSTE
jgi:hypothetical protein